AGNVTPLISVDGFREQNDLRRGAGVFDSADKGMDRLRQHGIIFGNACTVTGKNMDETMSDDYVEHFIKKGAMYIWYYVYRPVGAAPHPQHRTPRPKDKHRPPAPARPRAKPSDFIYQEPGGGGGETFRPGATGGGVPHGPQGENRAVPASLLRARDGS